MIQTFPNTAEGQAQAFAVPQPREISSEIVNGERVWVVRTGDDLTPTEPITSVENWQMARALSAAGLRDQVEAAIAQAPQDVRDMWSRAPRFERSHPFIEQVRVALGLTNEQVDALFAAAAAITT